MIHEPPIGAHLVSPRQIVSPHLFSYTHHGIYVGDGRVVHYSGWSKPMTPGVIEEVSWEEFAAGNDVSIRDHPDACFSSGEIVARVRGRVGEDHYSLFAHNCEHFATWAITGLHSSEQVDAGAAGTALVGGAATGAAATTAVVGAGTAMGLAGGAGMMKAVATLGGVIGGGAVAGIAATGALAGAGAAALVNNTLLAESEGHDSAEADARATGRTASYVGAGTAVAGSVAAIGAAGVSGFSAVGITSGLASIGGLLGGGMATGIAMTVAAPVVAATAIGYGTYKLAQHLKQDGKDKLPATEGLASDVIQVDEQPRVWHIRRGDKEVGPVTGREFLAAAEQGVLEPTDLIWREGLPNWIALADLPKIAGSSEQS